MSLSFRLRWLLVRSRGDVRWTRVRALITMPNRRQWIVVWTLKPGLMVGAASRGDVHRTRGRSPRRGASFSDDYLSDPRGGVVEIAIVIVIVIEI